MVVKVFRSLTTPDPGPPLPQDPTNSLSHQEQQVGGNMAKQRGDGTSRKTSHKSCNPRPLLDRRGNFPYYLFQRELGRMRHRRAMMVQGPSSLCPPVIRSALLRGAGQSSLRKSRLSLRQMGGAASRANPLNPKYREDMSTSGPTAKQA